MPTFLPRSIKLRGEPVYQCADCGTTGAGDTVELEPASLDADDIARAVRNIHPSHIPVGWACYGRATVLCPKCIR